MLLSKKELIYIERQVFSVMGCSLLTCWPSSPSFSLFGKLLYCGDDVLVVVRRQFLRQFPSNSVSIYRNFAGTILSVICVTWCTAIASRFFETVSVQVTRLMSWHFLLFSLLAGTVDASPAFPHCLSCGADLCMLCFDYSLLRTSTPTHATYIPPEFELIRVVMSGVYF